MQIPCHELTHSLTAEVFMHEPHIVVTEKLPQNLAMRRT